MMKVPQSIRAAFDAQAEKNGRLAKVVEDRISELKDPRWHFEGRVKQVESFALKIESGRIRKPEALEDFYACTLVVRNAPEIPEAERRIRERFTILERRPRKDVDTRKRPEQFPFDDLRLYAQLQENPSLPKTDLHEIRFEVQIKTFLQHAWSIATHDLIYKTDDVQWSKARIAYQIKAMLEHAELSIGQAEQLSNGALVNQSDAATRELQEIIAIFRQRWEVGRLPADIKRLAENVQQVAWRLDLKPARIAEILDVEEKNGRGAKSLNMSPYGVVMQAIVYHECAKLDAFLNDGAKRGMVMLPSDLELPADADGIRKSQKIIFA
jgi:ppGpp synthetase/RelA/SpoT-type nucleotidyltranferase